MTEALSVSWRRRVWLALAIFGTIFPNIWFMIHWVRYGVDLKAAAQLTIVNWITTGTTADLLTVFVIFWVWAGFELQRKGELRKLWFYLVLPVCLGLSCALPVFLYWHDRQD